MMRTTLDLDEDILEAAREIARSRRRSIGAIVSELARAGLRPADVEMIEGLPVIRARSGSIVITSEMIARALDEA